MKFVSHLLVAALGGVVAAVPAAPVVLRTPAAPPAQPEGEEKQRPTAPPTPDTCRVELRADAPRHETAPALFAGPRPTTEAAPALRCRRLAAQAPPVPPYLSIADDVRAGLRVLPPPAAA